MRQPSSTARGSARTGSAFSAVKHSFEKVGDHWEPKEEKGPSDERAESGGPNPTGESAEGVDANATKKHLMDIARRLDVEGRSTMNKAELVAAIMKANRRVTAEEPVTCGLSRASKLSSSERSSSAFISLRAFRRVIRMPTTARTQTAYCTVQASAERLERIAARRTEDQAHRLHHQQRGDESAHVHHALGRAEGGAGVERPREVEPDHRPRAADRDHHDEDHQQPQRRAARQRQHHRPHQRVAAMIASTIARPAVRIASP